MIPLIYADMNEKNVVRKVTGKPEVRRHLADIGFVTGAVVSVISGVNGNLLVSVKDSKIALDRDLAARIMI